MKYLYKEFEINGVRRIGEKTTVSDNTPGSVSANLNLLTDMNGLECYQLVDGVPVFVGPRPMTADEFEKAVIRQINIEFSIEKREQLIEQALEKSLEGKVKPTEYNNFVARKIAIRNELTAKEALKKKKAS